MISELRMLRLKLIPKQVHRDGHISSHIQNHPSLQVASLEASENQMTSHWMTQV